MCNTGYAEMYRMCMGYLAVFLFFFMPLSPAWAEPVPDVGMVTLVKGRVTYWNDTAGQPHADAVNFMKIRKNDQFRLGPDARIRLIFFSSGRGETWDGPAHFRLEDTGGNAVQGKHPQVNQLPAAAAREIRRISPLVDPARIHRSGYEQSRGTAEKNPKHTEFRSDTLDADEKDAVAEAKQVYDSLCTFSEPGDIAPELYLFNIMSDYDQYAEMDRLLAVMRGKQGSMAGIEGLEEWLNDRYSAWLKLQY